MQFAKTIFSLSILAAYLILLHIYHNILLGNFIDFEKVALSLGMSAESRVPTTVKCEHLLYLY
jgi:hypothetical protein